MRGAHYQLSQPTFYVGTEDQTQDLCLYDESLTYSTISLSPVYSLLWFHLFTRYDMSVSFCLPQSQTFTIIYSSMTFLLLITIIFEILCVMPKNKSSKFKLNQFPDSVFLTSVTH